MSVMDHSPEKPRPSPRPFPAVVRAFHWITAGVLLLLFLLAWTFDWIGPSDFSAVLVDAHRSFGVLIFLVVALRLIWRLTHPIEPLPDTSPKWERLLASGVQACLYLGLLAMPLLGFFASVLSGDVVRVFGWSLPDTVEMDEDRSDLLFGLHGILAWVLLGLTALHVAGALRHHFIKRDGLLGRMRIW